MISENPTQQAEQWPDLARRVQAFLVAAEAAADDGLTWREFGELMVALLRLSIHTVDSLSSMSGPDKKELVMAAVAALFDAVAGRAVPVTLWPVWLVARPAVRSLVLALASGAVEVLLPMVRSAP